MPNNKPDGQSMLWYNLTLSHKVWFGLGPEIWDEVFSVLSPRELGVINLRYGLGDTPTARTYQAIGDDYGVGRERIRQIEAKALRKMRRVLDRSPRLPVVPRPKRG
tara:strand:+ start:537 stop:854 length:318 start_codon:yes stop_codon:yes gene_type:complete